VRDPRHAGEAAVTDDLDDHQFAAHAAKYAVKGIEPIGGILVRIRCMSGLDASDVAPYEPGSSLLVGNSASSECQDVRLPRWAHQLGLPRLDLHTLPPLLHQPHITGSSRCVRVTRSTARLCALATEADYTLSVG